MQEQLYAKPYIEVKAKQQNQLWTMLLDFLHYLEFRFSQSYHNCIRLAAVQLSLASFRKLGIS